MVVTKTRVNWDLGLNETLLTRIYTLDDSVYQVTHVGVDREYARKLARDYQDKGYWYTSGSVDVFVPAHMIREIRIEPATEGD